MSSMVEVAREANVAVSTVSLTLNHRERVKPETRERIEQAMRRVGYRPREKNGVGRPKSVAMRVALIYTLESLNRIEDSTMTSYCREIISGMQEVMAGSSSFLSVLRGADHVDHDIMVNAQLNANEFDGVILFGADSRNGYLERLQQFGLPMVAINRLPEHGKFSCVTLDYYGGAQVAIKHLVDLGHRKIASAQRDESGKWLVNEICAGTFDALKVHGLETALDLNWKELQSDEDFRKVCEQIRERGVTAIFTGDHLGVRFIDTLTSMGIRVPEDVSVIGFDDRGFQTSTGLSLTTVGYDKRRMGRMGIRMLQRLSQSKGKLKWQCTAVTTHLVKGQTTAVAPDKA
ncbi:LacI family DNA-binding transcriptional regulator [soil metagenome]